MLMPGGIHELNVKLCADFNSLIDVLNTPKTNNPEQYRRPRFEAKLEPEYLENSRFICCYLCPELNDRLCLYEAPISNSTGAAYMLHTVATLNT